MLAVTHLHAEYYGEVKISETFSLYIVCGDDRIPWKSSIVTKRWSVSDSLACWILRRGEEYFFTEDILGAWICCLNMFPGPINWKFVLLQSNDQFEADRACQAFHVSNIVPQLARGADLTIMVWDGVSFHLIMFNIYIFETNLPLWPPHPTIMITFAHFHFNTFLIFKPTYQAGDFNSLPGDLAHRLLTSIATDCWQVQTKSMSPHHSKV